MYFHTNKGFSLIEIMVSVSIFSIIMLISMGSILSVLDANKKSQTLRSVMDNVNSTLESMTRTIRFGVNYHCGSGGDTTLPLDCASGDSSMTVRTSAGLVTYRLSSGRIAKSTNGGPDSFITSPDVTISRLAFRVFGSVPYLSTGGSCPIGNDCFQPQAIVVVSGYAGTKPITSTSFTLETTISQRAFDFK